MGIYIEVISGFWSSEMIRINIMINATHFCGTHPMKKFLNFFEGVAKSVFKHGSCSTSPYFIKL